MLISALESDAFVPNAANLSVEILNITDFVESVDTLQIVSYTSNAEIFKTINKSCGYRCIDGI